jgi:hypothetical protein
MKIGYSLIILAFLSSSVTSLFPYKKLGKSIFTTHKGDKIKQKYEDKRLLGAT